MLTTDIRIWGAVIASLLAPAASFGQESVKQPMDLEFRIRIAGDRTRFQVGETIPVELEFKSATPGVYQVSLRNYDRSGRLGTESFHVTPSGRDPLKSYFSHGVRMFGGLSSGPQAVTAASTRIQEDLNEWIALDRPGHYSLYVQSGRVSRIENKQVTPVDARSNTVEFDVVAADPEWQRQVLSSAKIILDDESSAGQEKLAAIRNLRFLGSEESVRELVHRLGTLPEGNRWEAKAGLLETVHRDLAVREMERQMSDPDVVVSYEYVSVLASLKMEERYNARPPFPRDDQEQQKKWREREAALEKENVALQDSLFQKAADWLSVKRGRARSEMTLAFLQRQRGADTKLSAEDIASAFAGLSGEQQERALSFNSERFRVAAMVEPLKKLVAQPRLEVYRLRDTALRTLYETDASEGRPEILKEIGHPYVDDGTFTVTAQTLGLLPERVMPELDELLLSRLGRGESKSVDLDAHLLARYASDAIVDRAKAIYEQRRDDWTCVSQDGFLLYFLRTDADYAVRQMARRAGFCLARSLEEVTRMGRWREVEPSVIRELRHADWKGRDAADTLKKYGSLIAKDAMWKRAKRFHSDWANRGAELLYRANQPREGSDAQAFQYGLTQALGRADGWVLSNAEVAEMESLTVGEQKGNVRNWRYTEPVKISVNIGMHSEFHATVQQYVTPTMDALARKMGQYPAGTRFLVTLHGMAQSLGSVRDAVSSMVREHGFAADFAADNSF